MPSWLRTPIARVFRRDELAEEIQAELRAHIALRADDLEHSGLSPAQAARRARPPWLLACSAAWAPCWPSPESSGWARTR